MPINIPSNWYRELGYDGQHPFAPIAWKMHDIDLAGNVSPTVEETLQEVIEALKQVEKGEYMQGVLKSAVRRTRLVEGKPVKKKSELLLKEAFAHAMINRQETFDAMTFEQFRTIYDDVEKFINEHKNPGKLK